MVHQESLAAVLGEFARTLATDVPVPQVLERFADRVVQLLPVTAAGVTLMAAGVRPRVVAASGAEALRFERLQTDFGQGPCRAACASGEAVVVEDVGADSRFPEFAPAALSAGLAAVFSFPLCHGKGRIGALNLYRDTAGAMDRSDMGVAQTLADVAAACLAMAQARDDARAASDQYQYGTLHDPLTGLPNRLLLQERLEHAARRARRSRMIAAILLVDLDRFRTVNGHYGHQVGDELLVAVASRLRDVVRFGDTLARLSGDEFVFLCEDVTSPEDAEILARRVDRAFADPFELSGMTVRITASVGVAFAGPGEDVSDDLLANADMAMYQAKRRGGAGHRIFDLRDAVGSSDREDLQVALDSALADDDLAVAYQPSQSAYGTAARDHARP